jgi:hypothetical protein
LAQAVLDGFFKKIKKAVKKVGKVVKNPAFLKLVSMAAVVVPGLGPVASMAISKGANILAQHQQRKEEKKLLTTQAEMQKNATVEAVAYAQAVATSSGSGQAQENVAGLVSAMSPEMQAAIQGIAPSMASQISQAGAGQVFESSIKGFGQAMAANRLIEGAGIEGGALGAEMSELDKLAQENPVLAAAIKQGMDDLLNSAALSGDSETFQTAMNRGTPSAFPWTPVLIGVGAVAVTGIILVATAY